jgi:hypothetical protein
MGIRQTLKEKPWIGFTVTLALIGVAVVMFLKAGGSAAARVADRAYFTIDDGQTYFEADRNLLAPFDHEGKQAVKVHMFSCDGGKTKVVGYLSKMDDTVKRLYEAEMAKAVAAKQSSPRAPMGFLVKKPGGKEWLNSMDPRKNAVVDINCQGEIPEIVHPD